MKHKRFLASLFITTSLSVAYSGLAYAQATTEDSSAEAPADESQYTLEQVTVTATRREEFIQNVPVAVTAVNEAVLERNQITNLADIGAVAPNTTVFRNPSSSSTSLIYIRGIGDDSSNILREFPVSQYIDGVYVGRNVGSLFELIGYDRVEILRGPQGTLYGRNSTGGAIKLVTTRPNMDSFSAKGDITIGSFDRRDFRAMLNIPLSDTLAGNISFGSSNNDGYYKNISTGAGLNRQDVQSMRGGLLWKTSDKLSFYLTGDYSHDNSGLQVPTQMTSTTGAGKDIPLYGDIYNADPDQPDVATVDTYGASLLTTYQLEKGTLEFTTGYRGLKFDANYDYGGAPVGPDLIRDSTQDQYSQEIQFASDFGGRVELVAGLFYFYEEGAGYEGFVLSPGGATLNYGFDVESKSAAAYTEATFKINDWLNFIAGGRVTYDDKTVIRRGIFEGVEGNDSWTKFTPKLSLQATINPDMMAYATYSQGYKAGIYLPFPGSVTQAQTALPPETVDAYEIGVKADWLDGTLRTNLAVFYNQYQDLQIGVLGDGAGVQTVSADEDAKGVELEITARPSEHLYVFSNLTYLDTEFVRVPTGSASYPVLGDQQRFSPESTFKVGAEYEIPFNNGDAITLGATYSWFDEQAQGFPNSRNMMGDYDLIDARIAYKPENAHWGIELSGKNLGDTEYWTYQSYLAGYSRYYAPGQTWSVRLKFDM